MSSLSHIQHSPSSSPRPSSNKRNLPTEQCTEMLKRILKGKDIEDLNKLLHDSCLHESTRCITSIFINIGANPNMKVPHPISKKSVNLIFSLLDTQYQKACQILIENPRTEVFCVLEEQKKLSLLHSAALQGNSAVIDFIFASQKFSIEEINTPYCVVSSQGLIGAPETVLSYATRKFQPKLMEFLIHNKADVYQIHADGEDCLTKAVRCGSSSETLAFLFSHKDIVSQNNYFRHTFLLHALIKNPIRLKSPVTQTECDHVISSINILLNHGSQLEALNKENHTPLYVSAKRPDLNEISTYLLSLGAEVQALYKDDSYKDGVLLPHFQTLIKTHTAKIRELFQNTTKLPPELVSIITNYLTSEPGTQASREPKADHDPVTKDEKPIAL